VAAAVVLALAAPPRGTGAMELVQVHHFTDDGSASFGVLAVDAPAHAAYLLTTTGVVKFETAPLRRVGSIQVAPGTTSLPRAALIDHARAFLYVARLGTAGGLLKIRLSDFSVAATLTLAQLGVTQPAALLIDNSDRYLYVGGDKLARVDLAAFATDRIVDAGHLGPVALLDPAGTTAYFATANTLVRVRLPDLTLDGTLALAAGEQNLTGGGVDPVSGKALVANLHKVIRFDLASFTRDGAVEPPVDGRYLNTVTMLGSALFAGTYFGGRPSVVVRVDAATLTPQVSADIDTGGTGFAGAAGDAAGGAIFLGVAARPPQIMKVNVAGLTPAGTAAGEVGVFWIRELSPDAANNRLYVFSQADTVARVPPVVLRLNLNTLATERVRIFDDLDNIYGIDVDLRHGWLFTANAGSPGSVTKVSLPDLGTLGTFTARDGENTFRYVAADPARSFVYASPLASAKIIKIDAATLARVADLTLPDGQVTMGAVDATGDFGYFYVTGKVVKVRLSNLTRVAALALPGGSAPWAMRLDRSTGFLYVCAEDLFRVKLADFTLANSLAHPGTESGYKSIGIDPAHGMGYAGAGITPEKIVAVQLSNLNRTGVLAVEANSPPNVIATAGDRLLGYAALGAGPASLGVFRLDDAGTGNRPPVISAGPSASPAPAEPNVSVDFSVSAADPEGQALAITWDFGDGGTAAGPAVRHVFTAPGEMNVVVTVADPDGVSTSASLTLSVNGSAPDDGPGGPGLAGEGHVACVPGEGAATILDRAGRSVAVVSSQNGQLCWDGQTGHGRAAAGFYFWNRGGAMSAGDKILVLH
jgi:hypothetical protein